MDAEALRKAWPLDALAADRQEMIASVPVPLPREDALSGEKPVAWAAVDPTSDAKLLAAAYAQAGNRYPAGSPALMASRQRQAEAMLAYLASFRESLLSLAGLDTRSPGVDPITTATIPVKEARDTIESYGP
jgi:hypothetical protein